MHFRIVHLYGKINNGLILVSQWKSGRSAAMSLAMLSVGVAGLVAVVSGHGAVTHPKPRQAIDGTIAPWNGTVPVGFPVHPYRLVHVSTRTSACLATPEATSSIYPRGVLARASLIVCRSFLATLREEKTQRVERWPWGCPVCMSHSSESEIQQTQQHNA